MLEEKLYNAIHDENFLSVSKILKLGAKPNTLIDNTSALNNAIFYVGYDDNPLDSLLKIKLLLEYGANVNLNEDNNSCYPLQSAIKTLNYVLVKILFLYGANPNILEPKSECGAPVALVCSDMYDGQETIMHMDILKICFHYGAYATVNEHSTNCYCPALHIAIYTSAFNSIKLLLENGANSYVTDIDYINSLQILEKNKEKYTQEQYQELKTLLNPKNPPYLKLGESEDDKYIIYENKDIETNPQPYLLTDKKKYSDKKYLYADNKSDAFVYWAYKNKLLTEALEKVIKKYISIAGEVTAKNIGQLITSTIGDELTSDMFNVEGKPFAVSYPTVTHWWYNLHTDFNRLYQDEDNRLPRAIKSQEEFDTLMKLLDIRYEQFKSGKDFNSNQNKAELQALLEGKEPPKREVDLSWLEEHCGEEDVSDNGAEKEKETASTPTIHLKSNQLAPKTGRYQATLNKEHPQAEFLESSGFDVKNVQEGHSIGTFGLSEEDEDAIVWVYLGE